MPRLNIYDRRERALVAAADTILWPAGLARRALRQTAAGRPRRILCLRLERIGDLIMIAPALTELRALAPGATIDLVVGSWNREIAATIERVLGQCAEYLDRRSVPISEIAQMADRLHQPVSRAVDYLAGADDDPIDVAAALVKSRPAAHR